MLTEVGVMLAGEGLQPRSKREREERLRAQIAKK
jgi:hypothetical protein